MATVEMVEHMKEKIVEEVRKLHPRLIEISHEIHDNPEIGFQEHRAAALLTGELERDGFSVERGMAGMETAFVGSWGKGKPVVGFLAEYDALRGIGHACGHNLIAVWALGAGIALKRALPELEGTIKVFGTPAEEGGGGKVLMAEAGLFRGLDAAIMMHPRDQTFLDRGSLAVSHWKVEFLGKSSHASAAPEKGISALDALLQVFFSVNAFRQMMKPIGRIHGCILKGGDAPNVIPDYTLAEFLVRSRDQDYLEELEKKFLDIVQAASLATGARSEVHKGSGYKVRVSNRALVEALRENMMGLGIAWDTPEDGAVGSSDIGDVSQLVPTIHPYMAICEKGIPNHNPQFAVEAASPLADEQIALGATLLSWTGADVLLRPDLRGRLRSTFRDQLGRDPQE